MEGEMNQNISVEESVNTSEPRNSNSAANTKHPIPNEDVGGSQQGAVQQAQDQPSKKAKLSEPTSAESGGDADSERNDSAAEEELEDDSLLVEAGHPDQDSTWDEPQTMHYCSEGILQPSVFPVGTDPADKELQMRVQLPTFQAGLRLMQEGLIHTPGCTGRAWDHVNGCACLQRQGRPGRRKAPVIVSENDLMAFPKRQLDEFVHRSGLERPQYAEYVRYIRDVWSAAGQWKRRLPDEVCDLGRGHLNEFRQLLSQSGLTQNGVCFLKEERDRSMNRQHQHAHRVRRKTTRDGPDEYRFDDAAERAGELAGGINPQVARMMLNSMQVRAALGMGSHQDPSASLSASAVAAAAGQYGGMFSPFGPYGMDMSLLSGLAAGGHGVGLASPHAATYGPPTSAAAAAAAAIRDQPATTGAHANATAPAGPGMPNLPYMIAQAAMFQNMMYPRVAQQPNLMSLLGSYAAVQPQSAGTEGPQPAGNIAHTPNELDAAHNLSLFRTAGSGSS